MLKTILPLLFIFLLLEVACTEKKQPTSTNSNQVVGDASRGRALVQQATITSTSASVAGCASCHSLEPNVVLVGPSLAGVASRAAERVSRLAAEDYLRQSIVQPNAYIVEGFSADVMYQHYSEVLSEDDLDALVAFLLTLE